MDDPKYKLKCLFWCIVRGFGLKYWWEGIWTQDLSESLCCDGRDCGCMGADGYAEIDHYVLKKPPPQKHLVTRKW